MLNLCQSGIVQELMELLKFTGCDLPCRNLRNHGLAGFLCAVFEAVFSVISDERAAFMCAG